MSTSSPTSSNPSGAPPDSPTGGSRNKTGNKKWWRRLWKEKEPPTIHLSTHFGNMNQQGRPGPIIGITLEKSSRGEPQALVVATPKMLERFRLDGQISKKVVLPSPITCFYSGRIAGIGRVHLCATQNGKIYFIQAEKMKLMDVTLDSSSRQSLIPAARVQSNSLAARESSIIVDEPDTQMSMSGHTDISAHTDTPTHSQSHTHMELTESLDSLTLAQSTSDELSALAIKSGFAELIQMVFAGNLRGETYCWSVRQGKLVTVIQPPDINDMPEHVMVLRPRPTKTSFLFDRISMQVFVEEERNEGTERFELRRASQSSHSLLAPSTQFVASICVVAQQNQLWIGYGTGIVALYDVVEMKLLFVICTPLREPVNSIEFCHQFDLVLILSGNNYVTLMSVMDCSVVRCYPTKLLTCETPLSCMKVFEDEPVQSGAKSHNAALLLGCTNGSICVRRLTTKARIEELKNQSNNENSENRSPTHNHTHTGSGSFERVDDMPSSPKSSDNHAGILCILIRNFIRETVPLCPLSTIAYDFSLDAAFIGDASGIVTTLYPISFLLRLNPLHAMQNASKRVQSAMPSTDTITTGLPPSREVDSSDTTEVDSNAENIVNRTSSRNKDEADESQEQLEEQEQLEKNSEGTELGAAGDDGSTRRDSADLDKLKQQGSGIFDMGSTFDCVETDQV